MNPPAQFPFSAVVGHDDVKLALLLNAVDRRIGGVLLRGDKGSAKSTVARGLAALLPGGARVVELPVSATEDRLVGALDLESALTTGRRRFQPGLLAEADGGVLYVDEINLLPDHLVDVLLDVAASGINRVERDGVSESHPSRFVLIGSMNPEEGELRPQLLDRFGLAVDVASSTSSEDRALAVGRRLAFDADPVGFATAWTLEEQALGERLAQTVPAQLPTELLTTISALCVAVGAEGLRADLVICRAAAALAGWEGRPTVNADDVRRVAPLALAHRRRRSPFDQPGIDQQEIDQALDRPSAGTGPGSDDSTGSDGGTESEGSTGPDGSGPSEQPDEKGAGREKSPATPDTPGRVAQIEAPRQRVVNAPGGRRSPVEGPRGRVVDAQRPIGRTTDVAVGPTLRAAAARRSEPGIPAGGDTLVDVADLRQAVREQRTGNLLVLAVDSSASMGAERRMEAVKGAVLGLLLDAYQRRDRVSLVTFGGDTATVVLRPTGSVEVAKARLAELPTGGRTPLGAGIETALRVATTAPPGHLPLLVVISDGRATAAPDGEDPLASAVRAAGLVRRQGVPAVVVDVENGRSRLGLAGTLAEAMGARHLTLPELSAETLVSTIRAAAQS